MMKNYQNPRDHQQVSIRSTSPGSYFEREDWTDFRTLDTLCRRAGVPREELPKLVVKELVDNALDGAGTCSFGALTGGGFYVEDKGAGLLGTDEDAAALFSISRPITSSKLIRMPTRGALGNGLRVVAGSVLATGGQLVVMTGSRILKLTGQDAGGTSFVTAVKWRGKGVRVEVRHGPALETTRTDIFDWARRAQALAMGQQYRGGSSPWWYDSDAFWALLQAAGNVEAQAHCGCPASRGPQ